MEDNNVPLETIIISLETVSLLCDEQSLVLLTHTAYTCLTRRAFGCRERPSMALVNSLLLWSRKPATDFVNMALEIRDVVAQRRDDQGCR